MKDRRIFRRVAERLLTEAEGSDEDLGNLDEYAKAMETALMPARKNGFEDDDVKDLVSYIYSKSGYAVGLQNVILNFCRGYSLKGSHDLKRTYDASKDPMQHALKVGEYVEEYVDGWNARDSAKPESLPGDENPKYGKYIFAPNRKNQVPPEESTPQEKYVYRELSKHILDNEPMEADAVLSLMQDLEDGAYSGILHEPSATILYRGIRLDKGELEKLIELSDVPDEGSHKVSKFVGGRPGSKEGSTAWSADPESAREFSSAGLHGQDYSVILFARRDENPSTFLEGPGGLYKVSTFSVLSGENESIALGPVRIYKVAWTKVSSWTKGSQPGKFSGDISEAVMRRVLREACTCDDSGPVNEVIRKCGSKWCLYTKGKDRSTGKRRRLGTHSSKAGAERQERAIKARGG